MNETTRYQEPPDYVNSIGDQVYSAAFQVHKTWGPGLLEHFYHRALYKELKKNGLNVESEVYLPIKLDDETIEDAYKMDLLVENEVVVEVKAVQKLTPVHFQQIRTYLRVGNKCLGFLINFNTTRAVDGINRQVMTPKQ
jgi:GxxExxY protein